MPPEVPTGIVVQPSWLQPPQGGSDHGQWPKVLGLAGYLPQARRVILSTTAYGNMIALHFEYRDKGRVATLPPPPPLHYLEAYTLGTHPQLPPPLQRGLRPQ